MAERVVVFLDWQNVYRRARAAFGLEADVHMAGQVNPVALARLLTSRVPDGQLHQVRIYRGIPTNKANPKGYAANRRQVAHWMRESPKPYVYVRPLQYLPGTTPGRRVSTSRSQSTSLSWRSRVSTTLESCSPSTQTSSQR